MELNRFNQKYGDTKLANLFLGFFEGLFIDEKIHTGEIKSLMKWVDTYPDCIQIPHFSMLFDLLVKSYQEPLFLLDKKNEMRQVFNNFKSSNYFKAGTADTQRLHGVLAGVACDKDLRCEEVVALKHWLEAKDFLDESFIYQDLMNLLKDVDVSREVSESIKLKLLEYIAKFINIDDEGLPLTAISSTAKTNQNPDFYFDHVAVDGSTFCLTGASNRYMKNEWKIFVESKGGIFIDTMTKKVDYLVICNKGNPYWAHMSYGRKFEQAKKMQREDHGIRILTEDYFADFILK